MLNSINGFDAARTNTPHKTSISKNNDMGQKKTKTKYAKKSKYI